MACRQLEPSIQTLSGASSVRRSCTMRSCMTWKQKLPSRLQANIDRRARTTSSRYVLAVSPNSDKELRSMHIFRSTDGDEADHQESFSMHDVARAWVMVRLAPMSICPVSIAAGLCKFPQTMFPCTLRITQIAAFSCCCSVVWNCCSGVFCGDFALKTLIHIFCGGVHWMGLLV